MSGFTLAVAQFGATPRVADNLAKSIDAVAMGADAGADLVVLPESSMYSDPLREHPGQRYSEPLDGPFVQAVREAAEQHRSHVVVGLTESVADGHPFNTLAYITPDGELAGAYRKVHLFDAFEHRESDSVQAGAVEALTFDVNGVTVGAATCYDIRFPEMSRFLVDHGADVIVLPTSWASGPMKEAHWETLLRARAIENTIYVAGSSQSGPRRIGASMIVDPMGVVVAALGEEDRGVAVAKISTERVAATRLVNPSLQNRKLSVQPSWPAGDAE